MSDLIEITSYGASEREYLTGRGALVRDWTLWDEYTYETAWGEGRYLIDAWNFPAAPECAKCA